MTGRTHDLAAITALGVIFVLRPEQTITLSTAITAVLANQIGGITPDVDQPTAPFWRNLPVGGMFGRVIGRLLGGHRFLTHSIVGLVLFGYLAKLLLLFVSPLMPSVNIDLVWWAYMIGMVSHLLMDTFTKEGVPWLLPIPVKFGIPPIKKMRITTDKAVENLLVFPGLLAFNAVFYSVQHQRLLEILRHYLV